MDPTAAAAVRVTRPSCGGGPVASNSAWVFAAIGDTYGSYASSTGTFVANPGEFTLFTPVPVPAALPLLVSALAGLGLSRRRA